MRQRIYFSILILITGLGYTSVAQVITSNPVFPTSSDAVVITFYSDRGDMGLKDYPGDDVYAHTGVITDKSTSSTDWKYVIAGWGTFIPRAKMTKVSANVYTLTISPSIRDFYGVPAGEKVLKLAFVFRNSGSTLRTGRDTGGTDIFYNVTETPVFEVMISQPAEYTSLVSAGQMVSVQVSASMGDSLILFQNGSRLKKVTTLNLSHTITASGTGLYKLVARAWKGLDMKEDSVFYFIRPDVVTEEAPPGIRPGVNRINQNEVIFLLYAPGKEHVFVKGDFNNWVLRDEGYMRRSADGNWYWLVVNGLAEDNEYGFQYLIDGSLSIPDPYATKVLDPWNDKYIASATYPGLKAYPEGRANNLVSVFKTNSTGYNWMNLPFTPPAPENLIIYELLVRDFVAAHDFATVRDTLDYLDRLGVNAIELMPVNEFEGNSSWGYNPAMYFAVDKYYGPADSLKRLIDDCHERGIAVILDIVLNHAYGSNPLVRMYYNSADNRPAADNPWFNVNAPNPVYSWGFDFNHESAHTQAFVDSVCSYWINEFKVDGFRFDFTKGFTNRAGDGSAYDASRIAILKRMGDKIWSYKPDAILILEHFAENSEEKELSDYGFLIWGNSNHDYLEGAMGYNFNLASVSYKNRGWTKPGLVSYMESHDEERMIYKSQTFGNFTPTYDTRELRIALKRAKLAATFFFTIPGPKMIWQFQELGYDYSIDFNGRVGEKPIRWDYNSNPGRRSLYDTFRALIELKSDYAVFSTDNFSISQQQGKLKRINLQHSEMDVVVLGNFDVLTGTIPGGFTRTGKWYEFFSGDSLMITSSTLDSEISLQAGEYRLYTSTRIERPAFITSAESPLEGRRVSSVNAFPNPFRYGTMLTFGQVASGTGAEIEIVSLKGQPVRRLRAASGSSEIWWDGLTESGTEAEPGIYFIKMSDGIVMSTGRLIKF